MLEINIEEDHNDVLQHIYRKIGAKKLPFSGLTLVHFDSHPDLLIPRDLQAADVFEKEVLLDKISIESWILPAVFAGHISKIIWLKPPWAHQIPTGDYNFFIGKYKETGFLRVSCALNYFLGELLYADVEDLLETKSCILTVAEIPLGSSVTIATDSCTKDEQCFKDDTGDKKVINSGQHESVIESLLQSIPDMVVEPYILDIDLDFFSTRDPFREVYTEKQYHLIRKIYGFTLPNDVSKKGLAECTQERHLKLAMIREVLSCVQEGQEVRYSTVPLELARDLKCLIKDLREVSSESGELVDWAWLHEVGSGTDDTELPHHVSSEEEISQLIQTLYRLTQTLPKPAVVTISRSSDDDYCPVDQVDQIQSQVLAVMESYGEIDIKRHYLDR